MNHADSEHVAEQGVYYNLRYKLHGASYILPGRRRTDGLFKTMPGTETGSIRSCDWQKLKSHQRDIR